MLIRKEALPVVLYFVAKHSMKTMVLSFWVDADYESIQTDVGAFARYVDDINTPVLMSHYQSLKSF